MVLKVFTKEDAPEMRDAEELGHELESEGYTVEFHDAEEPETSVLQDLYNIYDFPTFLATLNDGSEVQKWQGRVPMESDIKTYLSS